MQRAPKCRSLFRRPSPPGGVLLDQDRVYSAEDGHSAGVADLDGLVTLRGRHNARNVMAALATMEALHVPFREAAAALKSFPGLAHRLELVGHRSQTLFVNDSKATNVEATAVALASFERGIFWILGGRAKEGGLADLRPYFPRIERAYLIGEAEKAFEAELEGQVATLACGTLAKALGARATNAGRLRRRRTGRPPGAGLRIFRPVSKLRGAR